MIYQEDGEGAGLIIMDYTLLRYRDVMYICVCIINLTVVLKFFKRPLQPKD